MRFLAVLCLVFLIMSVTIAHAFATPRHGCAPLIPPTVPGPLVQPSSVRGLLSINEVLLTPAPHSQWSCPDAGTSPYSTDMWIEIYNPQDQALDLYSVHTSIDSGPNSQQTFYFPFGAAIGPHAFLVVFPHLASLFSRSEMPMLRLLIAGTIIDQITVPALGEDQSYARVPDGSNNWEITSQPSIDASNYTPPPGATPTPQPHHKKTGQQTNTNNTGKTGKGSTSSPAGGTHPPVAVNGTQPTWTALQLPSPTPTFPIQQTTTATLVTPQSNDAGDIPKKILITTGAVVLPLLLFFWRQFFTRRKKETGK